MIIYHVVIERRYIITHHVITQQYTILPRKKNQTT